MFVAGAPRVWYLFILATDNGIPQRQCEYRPILPSLMKLTVRCLAFCSLRINLLDLNDNAPGNLVKVVYRRLTFSAFA